MLSHLVMIVHRLYRYQHVACAKSHIPKEENKVALILEANTIIDEGAVMIHQKDASIANLAMMRPRRLNLVTKGTLFRPKLLKLPHCVVSVPQELLNIACHPF